MKYSVILAAGALFHASIAAPTPELIERQTGSGSGPFAPGNYKTDASLGSHTIYYPTTAPTTEKLPVLVWGNGGCSNVGTSNLALLNNIASYGFIAIAEGAPNGGGTSNAQSMAEAVSWAANGSTAFPQMDGSKIMVAGFSCGGVEAEDNLQNANVDTVGVVSSGLLSNTDAAKSFKKPILFILGGSSDIAYQNGERDYQNIPAGIPAWKGNIDVGHGGTLGDKDGGRFGKVLLNWMLYVFKNQTSGLDYLLNGYKNDGWAVEMKSIDALKPI